MNSPPLVPVSLFRFQQPGFSQILHGPADGGFGVFEVPGNGGDGGPAGIVLVGPVGQVDVDRHCPVGQVLAVQVIEISHGALLPSLVFPRRYRSERTPFREIRKAKNFSQKEVAMLLGLSQPRYSGYETGRAEPPIEILVRLSYLYDVPMNMLTQRDRLYRTNEDVQRQINQLKQQIEEIEAKLVENGGENATTAAAMEVMKNLLQEMQKANANPSIAQQLESTLDK